MKKQHVEQMVGNSLGEISTIPLGATHQRALRAFHNCAQSMILKPIALLMESVVSLVMSTIGVPIDFD